MKHLFKALLLLLALFLPAIATAHDFEVDGIYYNINGNNATVTYRGSYSSSYSNEYTGQVVIPETVTYNGTTYSVTSIGYSAFSGCTGLTSIDIPNSVTSIGYSAFSNCSGLTSINIGNSVTSIGYSAFAGCSGLTSVNIPNSVTTIGSSAFEGTGWYNNQPNGLVYAGLVAYKYKGTMPLGTNITIREGTVGIASSAFYSCHGLTSVTIPNSVTSIGGSAFSYCSGLSEVTIPNSVTSIATEAFSYCHGLTSVTIPNSVTSIGSSAFFHCSGLTSVTIPNSVTSIANEAFSGCSGLTRVNISDIAAWLNISFSTATANPLYCAHHLFLNGVEVKELIIPNTITTIKTDAFYGCSGLTSITIPESVNSIGNSAFNGCSGLTDVYSEITDPSLCSIGSNVFYLENQNYYNRYLHVPIGSKGAYFNETKWSHYFNIILEMGYVPAVPHDISVNNIYYKITSDTTLSVVTADDCTTLIIPSQITYNNKSYSVKFIEDSAFYGNHYLHEVTLPETMTTIGVAAFKNCPNLKFLNCLGMTPPTTNNSFDSHDKLGLFEVFNVPDYGYGYIEVNNDVNGLVLFVPYEAYPFYKFDYHDFEYFSYITSHEVTAPPDYSANITYDYNCDCFGINHGCFLEDWDPIEGMIYGDFLISGIGIEIFPTEESTVFTRVISSSSYYPSGWNEYDYPSSFGLEPRFCSTNDLGFTSFAIAEGKLPSEMISSSYSISHEYLKTHEESGIYYLNSGPWTIQAALGLAIDPCKGNDMIYHYSGDIAIPGDVRGYSVNEIGNRAFKDCVNLTSVTLPATIESIGVLNESYNDYDSYFEYNYWESFFLDDSLCFSNCPNLAKITCLATVPPAASNNSFDDGIYQNTTLYVPYSALEAYRNAPGWCNFQHIVGIDPVLATGIEVNPTATTILEGQTLQLTATVLPEETTNKAVAWASSNPTVAMVDENGLVTACSLGSATITAMTTDGSNLSTSCVVTVTQDLSNYDNYLSMGDTTVFHGDTIVIPVQLTNAESIIAFQTDICLPEGFTIVTDEDDEPLIVPSNRLTSDHVMMADQLNDGSVRVICYSLHSRAINGNEGDLFYIPVAVPEGAEGDYTIMLRNALLTASDYTELNTPDAGAVLNVYTYIPGDVNDSRTVTVTDIVFTAQYILQRDPHPFIFAAADMNGDGNI